MSQLITPILTAVATDLARTTPPAPQLDHDATAELIGPSDSTELAAPRSGSGGGNVVADALGNVVALLATRPALWQLLLGNRDRVPAAVAECLRLAPPLHWASRVTTRLVRLGGAEIPAHSRVLILLASAYRDERHWVDPEAFRLDRPLMGHHRPPTVTFTWDNSLLRLQAEALVHAMLDHLAHMELAGPSLPRIHRAHRGHLDLPICLIPHL
ncbi:cytochrome P450 [Streptosporangium lutulentum]